MSAHVVRNPDQLDGAGRFRDLLRAKAPNASEGCVVEDLDVVLRWYGPRYGLDAAGVFALIEIKHGDAPLTEGQRRTFGLLDQVIQRSDLADVYLGLFVLHDLGDRWRWHGDQETLTDDQLVDELEGFPRGVTW